MSAVSLILPITTESSDNAPAWISTEGPVPSAAGAADCGGWLER